MANNIDAIWERFVDWLAKDPEYACEPKDIQAITNEELMEIAARFRFTTAESVKLRTAWKEFTDGFRSAKRRETPKAVAAEISKPAVVEPPKPVVAETPKPVATEALKSEFVFYNKNSSIPNSSSSVQSMIISKEGHTYHSLYVAIDNYLKDEEHKHFCFYKLRMILEEKIREFIGNPTATFVLIKIEGATEAQWVTGFGSVLWPGII